MCYGPPPSGFQSKGLIKPTGESELVNNPIFEKKMFFLHTRRLIDIHYSKKVTKVRRLKRKCFPSHTPSNRYTLFEKSDKSTAYLTGCQCHGLARRPVLRQAQVRCLLDTVLLLPRCRAAQARYLYPADEKRGVTMYSVEI